MSTTALGIEKKEHAPLSEGGAGEIAVVRIDELHVDHLYQRDLIADRVEGIARAYDIVVAGTIVVSRRANGELWIVDGQHRTAAAKLAGEEEMLAQIIDGMTAEQEALKRIQGNYKAPDKAYEIFRARVFAGDVVANGLQTLLHEFDSKVNYVPDSSQGVNAVAAYEALYRMDEGKTLRASLSIIQQAFGQAYGAPASGTMIKAIGWFYARHGDEADFGRLVEKMREQGLGSITRKSANQKVVMGGSQWINHYRSLVEIYNERLADANKLEWRTARSSAWEKPRDGVASPRVGFQGGNNR